MSKPDAFRSEEERFFYRMATNLPQFVEEFRGFEVERVAYEGKTFRIGEVKYTPDFNVVLKRFVIGDRVQGMDAVSELRCLVNVEVKGSKKQRGYVTTRAKLVMAASVYPEYAWVEVLVDAYMKVFESFEFIEKRPLVYLSSVTGV